MPQAPHCRRASASVLSLCTHQQCHPEVVCEFTEGQDGYWPLVRGTLEREERGQGSLVLTSIPLSVAIAAQHLESRGSHPPQTASPSRGLPLSVAPYTRGRASISISVPTATVQCEQRCCYHLQLLDSFTRQTWQGWVQPQVFTAIHHSMAAGAWGWAATNCLPVLPEASTETRTSK